MENLGLRKLVKNTTSTLARQIFSGLLFLANAAIIARVYGAEGNGIYAVSLLLPSILSTFLNLGIGPANVYFIGSSQFSPKKVLRTSFRLMLFLSLIGLFIGGAAVWFESKRFFPGVQLEMLIFALFIFPLSLMQSFIYSIFQGLQKFSEYNILLLAQPILMLGFIVSLFLLEEKSLYYLIVANIVVMIITLFLSLLLLQKHLRNKQESSSKRYIAKVIKYGYKAHLSNILAFINYKADIFLINFFINPAAAGVYVISVKLSEQLWILSKAVSTVLLPRLSELSNDEEKRLQITPLISRVTLWLTAFASIALASIAYPLILLVFGQEYLGAFMPMLILLPGIVFTSASRILANDLAARGRPELNMYTSWVVVIVNIIGNYLLIPMYGLLGAAGATTLAYVLNFILRVFMYKYITGVLITNIVIIKYSDVSGFFKHFRK